MSTPTLSSPADIRQGQQVYGGYSPYPVTAPSSGPSMAPPVHVGYNTFSRPGGNTSIAAREGAGDDGNDADNALFGNVPENKKRKFILVPDEQRGVRHRIKVSLDQMKEVIPDSFRLKHSVHPRAYFPTEMQEPTGTSRGGRFVDADGVDDDDGLPTTGRTLVPVQMLDGETEVAVPQLTRSKRRKEEDLNELGYRMAYSQSRVFAGRPIFLQRARE